MYFCGYYVLTNGPNGDAFSIISKLALLIFLDVTSQRLIS